MLSDVTSTYRCPVCGEETARELLLFLAHSNRHIFEILKEKHPEWATADGSWERYEKYFHEQLGS